MNHYKEMFINNNIKIWLNFITIFIITFYIQVFILFYYYKNIRIISQSLNYQIMNILQDLKENEFHQTKAGTKNKKTTQKSMNYQLEMQIGTVYNQVLKMLQEHQCNFKLPQDGIKSAEKVELLHKTIEYMLLQNLSTRATKQNQFNGTDNQKNNNSNLNDSNIITCVDCQNYQNNLQKLQNQVRQHIRLQQQLKIYQESMEQKIQEFKKQKNGYQKKIEDLKKKLEDTKHASSTNNEKIHKLEYENQKMKAELKNLSHNHKTSANTHHNQNLHAFQNHSSNSSNNLQNSKKFNKGIGYQSKENKIDWVPRQISLKKDHNLKDEKDRTDRKSIQKRGDSSDRWRMSTSNNTKSTRVIPSEKLIMQKNREERKKAIQSKFEYRR